MRAPRSRPPPPAPVPSPAPLSLSVYGAHACAGDDIVIETPLFLTRRPSSPMRFAARACACLVALQVRFLSGCASQRPARVDARQQGLRRRGRKAGRGGACPRGQQPRRARARAKNIARRAALSRFSTRQLTPDPLFPPHSWPPPGRCSVPPCWAAVAPASAPLPTMTPRRPTRAAAFHPPRPPSRLRSRTGPPLNSTSKSSNRAPCPSCRLRGGRSRSCRRCRSPSWRRPNPISRPPSRWSSLKSPTSRGLRSRLPPRTGPFGRLKRSTAT